MPLPLGMGAGSSAWRAGIINHYTTADLAIAELPGPLVGCPAAASLRHAEKAAPLERARRPLQRAFRPLAVVCYAIPAALRPPALSHPTGNARAPRDDAHRRRARRTRDFTTGARARS